MDVLVVVQKAAPSRATSVVVVDDAIDLHEGSCGRGGDGLHGTDVRLHDVHADVHDSRMARASGAGGSKRCRCKMCTMCGRKTWGEHVFKLGRQPESSSTRWLAVQKLIEVDGWMDGTGI